MSHGESYRSFSKSGHHSHREDLAIWRLYLLLLPIAAWTRGSCCATPRNSGPPRASEDVPLHDERVLGPGLLFAGMGMGIRQSAAPDGAPATCDPPGGLLAQPPEAMDAHNPPSPLASRPRDPQTVSGAPPPPPQRKGTPRKGEERSFATTLAWSLSTLRSYTLGLPEPGPTPRETL